eukprot:510093_1
MGDGVAGWEIDEKLWFDRLDNIGNMFKDCGEDPTSVLSTLGIETADFSPQSFVATRSVDLTWSGILVELDDFPVRSTQSFLDGECSPDFGVLDSASTSSLFEIISGSSEYNCSDSCSEAATGAI